jgi:hypothetical protein
MVRATIAVQLMLASWGCGLVIDLSGSPIDASGIPAADTGLGPAPDAGHLDAGSDSNADGGTLDAEGCPRPCGIEPQCGCGAGLNCYFNPTRGRFCSAPSGTDSADGRICADPTDCQPGLICARVGTSPEAVCTPTCTIDADCMDPARLCVPQLNSMGLAFDPPIAACSIGCDPITGDGCPGELSCDAARISSRPDEWVSLCRTAGTGGHGDSCTQPTDCQRNHICAQIAGVRHCVQMCVPATPCPGGYACATGITPPIILDGEIYGICPLP